ncbi:MAG: ABC transporter ATP-binding protein/permease [Clostridia bacterium]
MLQFKDLYKTYQPSKEVTVHALNGINLTIPPNGLTFLLGPSGCGKSTMLNILGGLDNFTSGDFLIDDISTKDFTENDWDDYRNKRAGFVFQDYNLIEEFNVYDNVAFALDLQKISGKKEKVESALQQVGLLHKKDKKIYQLSGGERQRVSIARAIVKEPQILLADEPTGNLDVENSKQIFDLLKELSKHRVVVVVTHDENFAKSYADYIIYMRDGQVVNQEAIVGQEKLPEVDASVYGKRNLMSKGLSFARIIRQSFINMWHTKWKMLSAVVLLIFSLALFGAGLSATRYDKQATLLKVYEEKNVKNVVFAQKNANVRQPRSPFSLEEQARVEREFGKFNLAPIMSTGKEKMYYKTDVSNIPIALEENFGYITRGYQIVDQAFLDAKGFKILEGGVLPTKMDEMLITTYTADVLMYSDSYRDMFKVNTAKDLIGKQLVVDFMDYKPMTVVGIIDTGFDPTYATNKLADYNQKLERESYNYHNIVYVSNNFKNQALEYGNQVFCYTKQIGLDAIHQRSFTLNAYNTLFPEHKLFLGKELKAGEIIMSYDTLKVLCRTKILNEPTIKTEAQIKAYIEDLIYNKIKGTFKPPCCISQSGSLRNTDVAIDLTNLEVVGINYFDNYTVLNDVDYGCTQKSSANTLAFSIQLTGNKETDKGILKNIQASYDIMDGYAFDVDLAGTTAAPMMLFGMIGSALFCIFGVLMLVSFIVDNIKVNNYQIGVMRCLGVKRKDVISMFLIESIIVALIAFLFACALFFPITKFMQRGDQSTYLVDITVFKWKFVDIIAMFALGVGVALVATIVPILSKTKEKPINILRSLE